MLDFYAIIPFYANMFTNADFPSTTPNQQAMSDDLVESLVVSGNEAEVATLFNELLASDLDESMASLVPTAGVGDGGGNDDDEQA